MKRLCVNEECDRQAGNQQGRYQKRFQAQCEACYQQELRDAEGNVPCLNFAECGRERWLVGSGLCNPCRMAEVDKARMVDTFCGADNCQNPTQQSTRSARRGSVAACSYECRHRIQYGDRYRPELSHLRDSYAGRCELGGGSYTPGITRDSTLKRDGNHCAYCDVACRLDDWTDGVSSNTGREIKLYGPTYPSLDHVVPLSAGGDHSEANVVIACMSCNLAKGSSTNWATLWEMFNPKQLQLELFGTSFYALATDFEPFTETVPGDA